MILLALEILVQVACVLIAALRIGLQAMPDDCFYRRGDGGVERMSRRQGPGTVGQHEVDDLVRDAAIHRKRMPAGQKLMENDTQRIKVAASIHRLLAAAKRLQMLGRHVRQRAAHGGGCGAGAMLDIGRQIEIEKHGLAVVGQQDVGRLQVTVEDAPFVGMAQAIRQPPAHPQDGMDVAHPFELLQKIAGGRRFRGLGIGRRLADGGSLL